MNHSALGDGTSLEGVFDAFDIYDFLLDLSTITNGEKVNKKLPSSVLLSEQNQN